MEKKLTKVRFDYESVKILSFESGPLVDKQYTYHIIFSTETCCSRWEVNHKFSHFKLLNLLIKKLAPKFVSAEFPKDNVGSSFLGLKLSDKVVEGRRRMLEDWLKEVISNYELFPEEIAQNLRSFINAPKVTRVELQSTVKDSRGSNQDSVSSSLCSADGGRQQRDLTPKGSTSRDKKSLAAAPSTKPGHTSTKRNVVESLLLKVFVKANVAFRRGLANLSSKLVRPGEGSAVLCLSRRNEIVTGTGESTLTTPLLVQLFDELSVQMHRYAVAFFLSNLFSSFFMWLLPRSLLKMLSASSQSSLRLFTCAIALFCRVVCEDDEQKQSNVGQGKTSQSVVEDSLRLFFRVPDFSYNEEGVEEPLCPFDGTNSTMEKRQTSQSGTEDRDMSSKSAIQVPLHDSLVPGSTFDNVDFVDVSPQAKALYADRSEEHSFKLRGENYLTDNKKVHPGPAMCKLLLLELYEVDPKDGNRHDHIVSRGAAKRRLEALRTLPDKPFLFIINFQIPGDPPVSIVSYFGLPVDLLDRYPGPETERFLAIFERFIDMPRTEEERLAAWGITSADPTSTSGIAVDCEDHGASGASPGHRGSKDGSPGRNISKGGSPSRHPSLRLSSPPGSPEGSTRFSTDGSSPSTPSSTASQVDAKSHGRKHTPNNRRRSSYTSGINPGSYDTEKSDTDSAPSRRLNRPISMPRGFPGLSILPSNLMPAAQSQTLPPKHPSNRFDLPLEEPILKTSNSSGTITGVGIPYFRRALNQLVRKNSDRLQEIREDGTSPRLKASSHDEADSNSPHRLKRAQEMGVHAPATRSATGSHSAELDEISDVDYATDQVSVSDELSGKFRSPKRASYSGVLHAAVGMSVSSAASSEKTGASNNSATAAAGGGGWKMPSDISWPEPHEPGALPPNDFRNQRFKLIPSVTEGPWVVKAAVRSTPALLGKKVVQRYFRGDDYMEVDVDVGSSKIAANIVGLCRGYAKHFSTDVGIVIQGENEMELPEKMLACGALKRIEVDIRQKLD